MWVSFLVPPTILVLALAINVVTSSNLGLSQLALYNVQRIDGKGYGRFTSSLSLNTMKRSAHQQQVTFELKIQPQGETAVRMKNGAMAFFFRGSEMLFPPSDDLYSADTKFPILRINQKLQLREGDSVLIMIPLDLSITSKPVDIMGALAYQRPDKDFIESYARNLPEPLEVAIIGATVIDKARIDRAKEERDAKVQQTKEEQAEVPSLEREHDELNLEDVQWASFIKPSREGSELDLNTTFFRLLSSLPSESGTTFFSPRRQHGTHRHLAPRRAVQHSPSSRTKGSDNRRPNSSSGPSTGSSSRSTSSSLDLDASGSYFPFSGSHQPGSSFPLFIAGLERLPSGSSSSADGSGTQACPFYNVDFLKEADSGGEGAPISLKRRHERHEGLRSQRGEERKRARHPREDDGSDASEEDTRHSPHHPDTGASMPPKKRTKTSRSQGSDSEERQSARPPQQKKKARRRDEK